MIREFVRLEASGGILLLLTLVLALFLANTAMATYYQRILHTMFHVGIGSWSLNKPLLLWINEGLMTIFFMLLALEIKREILAGQLSEVSQVVLPCIAALGGIVVPVAIFATFNYHDPHALVGWAIPTATDVALALGVVTLLGKRVPVGLKVFLVVLAIFDDIVAIALIAIFYTQHLAYLSLTIAALGILGMILLNYFNVSRIAAYMILGAIVWLAVLKSGVHATLAGVAIGFCIPFKVKNEKGVKPLQHLEHTLHPWVAYLVLPLFVLANAGVAFHEITLPQLTQAVPLGVGLGLFLGKQIGIFGFSWVAIRLGYAKLPKEATWLQLYGVALLAGIGFTMSLFISGLAYENTPYELLSRAGILLGSFFAALAGIIVLLLAKSKD